MDSIILIGFMGTGKSTVGRLLAARLNLPFADTDEEAERAAGRTIPEIFAAEGETGFRRLETEAVRRLAASGAAVIATGGGAVLSPENMAILKKAGRLVWLEASPEEILARVKDKGGRPLLETADPLVRISELLSQRRPLYRAAADLVVATGGLTPEQVVEEILEQTGRRGLMTEIREVRVELGSRGYPIYIGPGMLDRAGEILAGFKPSGIHLITDRKVDALYGDRIRAALRQAGLIAAGEEAATVIPEGEESKSLATASAVYDDLIRRGLDRRAMIVALGGGVVGDLGGFIAATFLRGVDFFQIPTTLLAQVDSSVGGKVAVNHPLGKNLIGAFHQPRAVLADTGTLASLPPRELASGLTEGIKHGMIRDSAYLGWIESNGGAIRKCEPEALGKLVEGSCLVKASVVASDEREAGTRAILNFGHTVGHAIEKTAGYGAWAHGEAVAAGMMAAVLISRRLGLCRPGLEDRLKAILEEHSLPASLQGFSRAGLMKAMSRDKKRVDGVQRWVLIEEPGRVRVTDRVDPQAVEAALEELGAT